MSLWLWFICICCSVLICILCSVLICFCYKAASLIRYLWFDNCVYVYLLLFVLCVMFCILCSVFVCFCCKVAGSIRYLCFICFCYCVYVYLFCVVRYLCLMFCILCLGLVCSVHRALQLRLCFYLLLLMFVCNCVNGLCVFCICSGLFFAVCCDVDNKWDHNTQQVHFDICILGLWFIVIWIVIEIVCIIYCDCDCDLERVGVLAGS